MRVLCLTVGLSLFVGKAWAGENKLTASSDRDSLNLFVQSTWWTDRIVK